MADNFFKIKNGLNLPTLTADPTVTPPANSVAGDLAFYNGRLYAHNGTAWGIRPGSGPNGLITNTDVEATAAIDGSKIVAASASVPGVVTTGAQTLAGTKTLSSNPTLSAMTTAGVVHNAAGGALSSSLIVNADVSSVAGDRIDGNKITPNFGSQNITTSGSISSTGTGTITSAGILRTDSQLQVFSSGAGDAAYIRQLGNGTGLYLENQGTGNTLVITDQASPDTTAVVVDASGNMGIGVDPSTALSSKLTVAGSIVVNSGGIFVDNLNGIDASGTLSVGTSSTTTTINVGTSSSAQSVNLGAGGSGVTTINLGGTGDSVVAGTDIKFINAKGIESSAASSTLNIGTGSNTTTLNLGTGSSTQTVNIGTGAGTTTINIGGTGDSVVIAGTLTTVNTTNLDVADKNITINKGGLAGSANGSGISIEAGGSSVASLTFDQTDGGAQPQNTFTLSGTGSLALPSGTTAQRPNTPASGMVRYNNTDNVFEGYNGLSGWGVIGGATTVKRITQSTSFAVGDVLYLNGSTYTKALATTAAAAEVCAVVSKVLTAGSVYEITIAGEVTGLLAANFDENALPATGEAVFLSPTNAGKMTITEPSVVGQVSIPVGIISDSGKLFVNIKRGAVVGGANVRTSITLANNATTNVQNVSAYEAGELTGWVTISATTPLRFFVRAPFARNGAASDYNLSYQTTGDTPPAGFSMGVTAAGVITATLPTITGYSTASINFALNAPAVGATLPLQIDSSLITWNSTTLSDSNATQLGLKQYVHGTNYNGGNAPTVTSPQAGFSVIRAVFIPYQTQDGSWRLKVNLVATYTLALVTSMSISVNGIVSKNTSTYFQTAAVSINSSGTLNSSRVDIAPNGNTFSVQATAVATSNTVSINGDIELNAKPTWAY